MPPFNTIDQANKDSLSESIKNYNNLNDVTVKLELEKTKKEAELSKLSGDAARVKRLEIDNLTSQINYNNGALSDSQKSIDNIKKKIIDLSEDPFSSTSNQINTETTIIKDVTGIPGVPQPTVEIDEEEIKYKENVESNKLKNISESTPSIDGSDTAGFVDEESTGANEISEIRKGNDLYTGLKSYDDQSLDGERIKYYNSDNKVEGFIMPWDSRFGYAYTNTQSVGNHMPFGDEWVGSPALMNPYALIRFEHIAGAKHHKYLIDQKNNVGFKGTLYKPYANISDYNNSSVKIGTNEAGEKTATFSDSRDRAELGITESDGTTYIDESGSLYINEVDFSQEIWKPTKDVIITETGKTYSKTDDPSEVVVFTPMAAQNAELNRANKIIEMRNASAKNQQTKKYNNTITEADLKKEADSNSTKIPTAAEFWIEKQGWKKCKDSTGKIIYAEPQHCEGDTLKKDSPEVQAQIERDAIKARAYIVLQLSRGWEKQGNATKKRYLRKPNTRPVFKEPVEPTVDNLVNPENWVGQEQFSYRWADFLYCKYYGLIPNNFLLTLRRYPMPVNDAVTMIDQIKTKQHLLPVSSAVTWMGAQTGNQVSELMSFSFHMNWRDLKAEINEIQGNEQGASDSPFGEGVGKWLGILSGQSNFNSVSGWDEQRAKFDPYRDGAYANRVYGPVNVIESTKARDRGLGFEHQINLNFHYTLKSIGGINPKAAMLDIMANMLALTYNNAGFWGGANRYFPNKPAYPFPGGKKSQDAWYSGNATGMLDGLADQLSSALGNIGSFVQNLLTNPKEALKGLSSKGTQLFMAEKQRDKRPGILGLKALLTGDPVGEWHLVVGNPFNPMMMIGNLICTSTKISFSDRLSADDFPDEMTVTVTLDHGMPRDKGSIESMFNRGSGRLHYSYFGQDTEFWNNASSTRDSKIDNPTGKQKIENNFTGKTETMNATTGGTYGGAAVGGAVKDAWGGIAQLGMHMGKIYNSTNKQAVKLSEKIGFKSGGE